MQNSTLFNRLFKLGRKGTGTSRPRRDLYKEQEAFPA